MQLSPENFERLLNWLHPNREEAGQEYQRIRELLIKNFQAQGCSSPDRLADATIDRTAQVLTPEEIAEWVGRHKEKYFYRVGYYILLEERDKRFLEVQMPDEFDAVNPDEEEDPEPKLNCLHQCLQLLSDAKRDLITRYYFGSKATKIRNREQLARELKLELPILRVRALRIRKELRVCLLKCLERADKTVRS